ncbi:uncharacterized protein LOC122757671, partial [Drosophila mojavensis]|uniref:uncharacterized protein LOC122757671 n=1 Tax=Drosophila mojavensis TaxID=7230 RepID=UPI001CD10B07
MADLPKDVHSAHRHSQSLELTIVDLFYYKPDGRNRASVKCYVCVFVCFTTKAVWLELAKGSVNSCLLGALKRFCQYAAFQHASGQTTQPTFFDWKFIPPRSPHFNGLWEAAVKTAKRHLYRSMGSALLGFDELRTLKTLMILEFSPRAFPDWSTTYRLPPNQIYLGLTAIASIAGSRVKWRTPRPSIKVNDVVCVKDENLPPLKWPLARVVEIIAGADGAVRVAVLRTPLEPTRRAVNKLCVLPVDDPVKSHGLLT